MAALTGLYTDRMRILSELNEFHAAYFDLVALYTAHTVDAKAWKSGRSAFRVQGPVAHIPRVSALHVDLFTEILHCGNLEKTPQAHDIVSFFDPMKKLPTESTEANPICAVSPDVLDTIVRAEVQEDLLAKPTSVSVWNTVQALRDQVWAERQLRAPPSSDFAIVDVSKSRAGCRFGMLAGRPLVAGEMVMKAIPWLPLGGGASETEPAQKEDTCHGCAKSVEASAHSEGFTCPFTAGCDAKFCSAACFSQSKDLFHSNACSPEHRRMRQTFTGVPVAALLFRLLSVCEPGANLLETHNGMLASLESSTKDRDVPLLGCLYENVIRYGLHLKSMHDVNRCSFATFLRVLNALSTNMFENGVFPEMSFVNHSCTPNARWDWGPDATMHIYAHRDISAGEEITLQYCDVVGKGVRARREALQDFGFRCMCDACARESAE